MFPWKAEAKYHRDCLHSKSAALPFGSIINPLELWRPRQATRNAKSIASKHSRHFHKRSDWLNQHVRFLKGRVFGMTRPVSQCSRSDSTQSHYKAKSKNIESKKIFVTNPKIQFAMLLQRRVDTGKPQSRPSKSVQRTIRLNKTSQLKYRKGRL
eukprot:TRINITY_DN9489_c0_g3_i1.p1 TRINITY_DN9489_c0_g3~~TRINITY_DN9489_c0_g3_i1.p1  ORF type:complete len:154 (-),score=8.01 TRINITY_DN9489_c0_g3_i1:143-604(-)